jgi:hypothetical protein
MIQWLLALPTAIAGAKESARELDPGRARLQPCRKCAVCHPALAAEVRFFTSEITGKSKNSVPQGLKPSPETGQRGTAEAVPFQELSLAESA